MALPTSGPISMSMVATEFSSSQTTNMSLFGFASELSTPITTNIELAADFYGESAFSGTSFSYNSTNRSGGSQACALEDVPDTAYHDGSGTYPVVNDKVYTNNTGTTALSNGFYKYDNGQLSGGYMEINNNNGNVRLVASCGK